MKIRDNIFAISGLFLVGIGLFKENLFIYLVGLWTLSNDILLRMYLNLKKELKEMKKK